MSTFMTKRRKFDPKKDEDEIKVEFLDVNETEKYHKKPKTDKVNEPDDDGLNINSLPDLVMLEIFRYLSQNMLGQISRVCRRWNLLTRSPVLWTEVDVRISPCCKSPTAVTKNFIHRLPTYVRSIRLDFKNIRCNVARARTLEFMELCIKLQENCPKLKEILFSYFKFSCDFSSAIHLCTMHLLELRKLVFSNCIFRDCSSTVECSGTSKIEILNIFDCGTKNNGPLNKPPFFKMPYLRELQLFGSTINDSWFQDDISFLNQFQVLSLGYTEVTPVTFKAIKKHGLNLQELCLCLIDLQDRDLNINNSVFPQLKTICLTDCDDITCEGIVSLVKSIQSLQNLYINEELAEPFAEHPFIATSRCKSGIVKPVQCNHGQ